MKKTIARTKFTHLFTAMIKRKFQVMSEIIGFYLLALVISLLPKIFAGSFFGSEWKGNIYSSISLFSIFAIIIAFVFMSIRNEAILTANRYRLIPVSDLKLYLTDLLTTFLGMVYFLIVEAILVVAFFPIKWSQFQMEITLSTGQTKGALIRLLLNLLLIFVLGVLVAFVTISFIRLVTLSIVRILPAIRQRFFRAVIYVIIIYLIFQFLQWVFHEITRMISYQSTGNMLSFLWFDLIIVIFGVVEAIINIVLLNKWVETRK